MVEHVLLNISFILHRERKKLYIDQVMLDGEYNHVIMMVTHIQNDKKYYSPCPLPRPRPAPSVFKDFLFLMSFKIETRGKRFPLIFLLPGHFTLLLEQNLFLLTIRHKKGIYKQYNQYLQELAKFQVQPFADW